MKYQNDDHGSAWETMMGNSSTNNDLDYSSGTSGQREIKAYAPLQFWFCRHNGLALPLIALQYHEVRVKITFNDKDTLYVRDYATTV